MGEEVYVASPPLGMTRNPPQTGALRNVFSKLNDVAWSVSHQIKRISDYVQGHAALSQSCAWLMGIHYGSMEQDPKEALTLEAQDQLLQDFRSRVWCTYRRDFPPIGKEGLIGDVGWGCTIRSGQMMMAEVLSRHLLGRGWRKDPSCDSTSDVNLTRLLGSFLDQPQANLSIHQICAAGQPHGVVPGKWLGPWVLCKGLASLVNGTQRLGLRMHVVCDQGGGAPSVDSRHLLSLMGRVQPNTTQAEPQLLPAGSEQQPLAAASEPPQQPPVAADAAHVPGAVQEASGAVQGLAGSDESSGSVMGGVGLQQLCEGGCGGAHHCHQDSSGAAQQEQQCSGSGEDVLMRCSDTGCAAGEPRGNGGTAEQQPGLVLLLPLTLGVGRANALYYPQLLQVLTFPQSVGIVGGRPSASLYFIGQQDQNLMYLDPHFPQPAGPLPAVQHSYFCDTVRLMPISNIDPSLAIGFYCRDADELEDLISRLDKLAVDHRKAPLVTVTDGTVVDVSHPSCHSSPPSRQDSRRSESWEMPHRASVDRNGGVELAAVGGQAGQQGSHKRRAQGGHEDLESWEVL